MAHRRKIVRPANDTASQSPRHVMPLLLLFFFGSGCAALIYEVVWLGLLQLIVGSSAVSLAVLLGTFMGGMCLGSLALPRLISGRHHPLRVYALIEIGLAGAGLAVVWLMPAIARLYATGIGHGWSGIVLRGLVCAGCLLPPTMLMGATLPAIARWIEATPRGMAWLGFFYGGNTAGAVAGCLLAGFYLLRIHDFVFATWCAAALNVLVALGALALASARPARSHATTSPQEPASATPMDRSVLGAIAISGFCALSAEVIWTRLLALLLGGTVYTFSIILAVFLAGLGLGSSCGAYVAGRTKSARFALGCCQLLLVTAIAWAAHLTARELPFWPVDPAAATSPAIKFKLDLARCAWAIFPAALLWGASFPLALAAAAAPGQDSARIVSRVYAVNTLGAILGAVVTSLSLLPGLGTRHTEQLLIALSAAAAGALLWRRQAGGWAASGLALAAGIALLLGATLPAVPWQLVAYGWQINTGDKNVKPLFVGEGMNATVAVTQAPDGARFFHVSGKTEASNVPRDMRLQRMLGHLPALLHPRPRSVLIVGCGAGVTAGSFVLHPSIKRIVICEIEPLVPRVIAAHFAVENFSVVRDPRVEIVYDDARHYLAATREKFDIITSDPIHPWVKGSAVLYTQEYFELCREHLNGGGFVSQWVPFYESSRAVVQSELATFFRVFPHSTVWGNETDGIGYDSVVLGQAEPLAIGLAALHARLNRPANAAVKKSLADFGRGSMTDLLSTYAGRASDLAPWLQPAEINRDRSLRLQYLAGLQLGSTSGAKAYAEMLSHRRFPEAIFQGSAADQQALRQAMFGPKAGP